MSVASTSGQCSRQVLATNFASDCLAAASEPQWFLQIEFPEIDSLVADPTLSSVGVLLGHPRIPVLRRLCRDLASLGVEEIAVCGTELSEKSYFSSSFWSERQYEDEFLRGAMQGGLSCLPTIQMFWSVRDCLRKRKEATTEVFLDLDQAVPPLHSFLSQISTKCLRPERSGSPLDLRLAIGPERGWTEKEVVLLAEAGFHRAQLGRQILRTETAAILAAGMARHLLDSP